MINKFNKRYFFDLIIWSNISFASDKAKELLDLVENKRIKHLQIQRNYLDREETQVFVNFLSLPHITCSELTLKLANVDDVTNVLKAIENRYSFKYANIMTKEPVSKEAEELALKILDTHIGCSLYLNSNIKVLRSLKEKGVEKH